ncbi:MAG: hydrolase [Planctomycetaceae bacterium]|nr:hydrolase [Planctomycetaceae bacterium]
MRHKTILGVHVCLIQGDHIFLLRRFQTGYEDGAYTVIAGHVDAGESARAAAVREVAEEAGVAVLEADLSFVGCMHRRFEGGDAVNLFFQTTRWLGTPMNAEPHRCDHADWFQRSNLPVSMVSYIRVALAQDGIEPWYLEYGWNGKDGD